MLWGVGGDSGSGVVKFVVKLKNCWIGTKIGVVVEYWLPNYDSGKMCGKICGKIEKLLDWNKNWCGSRYWHPNYDSGLW